MAYATSNQPRLAVASVGTDAANIWVYRDGDPISTVLTSGYFTDGDDLGMKVGDKVIVVDTTNAINIDTVVTAVTAGGAATVGNPQYTNGNVVSGTGATATLTVAQSGSTILFDRAAGIVFTLPAPVVGLKYRFLTTVDLTSNAYTVNTDAATTFLVGSLNGVIEGAATAECHMADGSTDIGISMNATTTGGLIGSDFTLECVSSTLWAVFGRVVCTATPATPFTT